MTPKLIVEQKFTIFINRYRVYQTNAQGEKGDLLAFVEQKRLAIKEKITFYADEQKSKVIFRLRAEKAIDVHGRYFIEDADGKPLGALKKIFGKSILKSTWQILDGNAPVFTVSESSKVLAFVRRFAEFVPIVGDILKLIIEFFRYHFIFTDRNGQEVGRYLKTTTWRDHYLLLMTDEAYAAQDWRVLAAMSVALDALQSR